MMEKIIFVFLWSLLFVSLVQADCTLSDPVERGEILYRDMVCEGAADGSVTDVTIPYDEDFPFFMGLYTWPIVGGTAPDAADILIFDASITSTVKLDLLGSTDGVTAVNGLNGISATVPQWIPPFNSIAGSMVYPTVVGNLTMHTVNQATNGADWGVRVYFYGPGKGK
jgi:hypothetical protein